MCGVLLWVTHGVGEVITEGAEDREAGIQSVRGKLAFGRAGRCGQGCYPFVQRREDGTQHRLSTVCRYAKTDKLFGSRKKYKSVCYRFFRFITSGMF